MKKSVKNSTSRTDGKSGLKKMITLAAAAQLMHTADANHFTRQATIEYSKKKRQHKQYMNAPIPYLEKSIENMNSALNTNKPVQSGKAILEKYPDIRSKSHPFHYGMPSEDKKIYTEKRQELLKKLSVAKEKRATNKLKQNINPHKKSKLKNRVKSGFHRGL
jgi:hypothetical protein